MKYENKILTESFFKKLEALIESNYKEDILSEHLLNCEEEDRIYLDRVPLTHLSYEKCNDFLINNMGADSNYQYIHQSSFNFKEDI